MGQQTKENPRNTKAWGKFDDFQTFSEKQMEHMKTEAASFTDDLFHDRSPRWISFLGTSGAGKTMLARIINGLYDKHRHGKIDWQRSRSSVDESCPGGKIIRWRGGFMNWGKVVNRMLSGDYEFLDDLRNYDFFVLDDIISEYQRLRELSASKLYDIFESRLNKWTVITANASLRQIGELLDPRISSRMLRGGSVVVDVEVPDYNLRTPNYTSNTRN